MQCSELELVFEQEGLSPLPKAVREHLAQCGACKHFVEDLTSIVAVAHQFPVELEPPERVWLSIRQQLVHDKTIREFSKDQHTSPWWHAFLELFRNRALATATVGVLLLIAALIVFQQPRPAMLEARDDQFLSTVSVLSQQERDLANMQLASTSVSPVDTSLRQNLQQVDEFIADCEHRVKEVPSDEIAREYLTNAYQQKAELLSAMMDRGGSLN
jgi:hypothetical protein